MSQGDRYFNTEPGTLIMIRVNGGIESLVRMQNFFFNGVEGGCATYVRVGVEISLIAEYRYLWGGKKLFVAFGKKGVTARTREKGQKSVKNTPR